MSADSHIWTRRLLGGVAFIALAALGVVTWHALRIEASEARTKQAAAEQESLRLALWRMDSLMTPILAREAARPYFEYESFYPAGRTYSDVFLGKDATEQDVVLPSPLLNSDDPVVQLHFQVVGGVIQSPQAPTGAKRELAEGVYLSQYAVTKQQSKLDELRGFLASKLASIGYKRQHADDSATAYKNADRSNTAARRSSDKYASNARKLEIQTDETSPERQYRASGHTAVPMDDAIDLDDQSHDDASPDTSTTALEARTPVQPAHEDANANALLQNEVANASRKESALEQVQRADYQTRAALTKQAQTKGQIEAQNNIAYRTAKPATPPGADTLIGDVQSLEGASSDSLSPQTTQQPVQQASPQTLQPGRQARDEKDALRGQGMRSSATQGVTATTNNDKQPQSPTPSTETPTTKPTQTAASPADASTTPLAPQPTIPTSSQQNYPASAVQEKLEETQDVKLHDAESETKNDAFANQNPLNGVLSDQALSLPSAFSPAPDSEIQFGPEATVGEQVEVVLSDFQAAWIPREPGKNPELVFRRTVSVGGKEFLQGFWINWTQLQQTLVEPIKDIYPAAGLSPVTLSLSDVPSATLGRMLASIPAELVVPALPEAHVRAWTPLRTALLATWVLVALALVMLALAARAMAELAERRGQFVSAVTHELRTPLTTFRLYSQMLSQGMVQEEQARRGYVQTLFSESQRLGRIVESVLDYARLGKQGKAKPMELQWEKRTAGDLASQMDAILQGVASHHNMTLDLLAPESGSQSSAREVRVDVTRLERILVNLVENAGKYGKPVDALAEHRAQVRWDVTTSRVRITVRDFGAGISTREAKNIFRPFTRGEAHAHGNTPGMGLGLSLSRGLAEQMGGSLVLHPPRDAGLGAEFVLELPA